MRHFHTLEEVERTNTWATIGTFDGVHRGHQAILAPMIEQAHAAGGQAAVVTFFPHPAVVLRGLEGAHYLTTPDERAALLGDLGIDTVVTLPFDRALAALDAAEFMQLLQQRLGLRELWVGYDFALGRNRQGDIPTLRRLGETMGYRLEVIPETRQQDAPVSSSQVRALLRAGQAAQAAAQLGRPYRLSGEVIHGDARGRQLGIRTANLQTWEGKIVPASGVYATWAWVTDPSGDGRAQPGGLSGQRVMAVTNIGFRPTFPGQPDAPRIETHLLDFNHDLYGQAVTLEFLAHLRSEQRFPSVDALVAQIHLDIEHAREVFAHAA